MGQHRDVAAVDVVGGGAHPLGREAFQVRVNVRSWLATMYQLGFVSPGHAGSIAAEQVRGRRIMGRPDDFCSSSGRSPAKHPTPSGLSQTRPSATSTFEDVGDGELVLLALEVSVPSGPSAEM